MFRSVFALIIYATIAFQPSYANPDDDEFTGRGQLIQAEDGFDLWFDSFGSSGSEIILVSRYPGEHFELAQALADKHRVLQFEPRHSSVSFAHLVELSIETGSNQLGIPIEEDTIAHIRGRNRDWSLSQNLDEEEFVETAISDLHTVADAAGFETFTIGGYSSTSLYAQFLTMHSDRITGILAGGFPLFDGRDYWGEFYSLTAANFVQIGDEVQAGDYRLHAMLVSNLSKSRAARRYRELTGPKIAYFGEIDGEPGSELFQAGFEDARIAAYMREQRAAMEELGFCVFEFEGLDHLSLLEESDRLAASLKSALEE